ncbi:cysteine desulfurase [Russula earlei]|uniref:Cysteine desulfurase n=1 Tax=Russula earlei TaxID=71964 RepID=A0ACC0U740_9AGAM|nr:cysteine desulfurase [Russula earlei]
MTSTVFSEQEIQRLRTETKGAENSIHFNNAGSSLPPDVVVKTMVNYLQEEAVNGGYETEYHYREQIDNTYSLIARLINAEKEEIALVENASTAWGIAFNGLHFRQGDVVITSEMEYVTNLIGFLNARQLYGIDIKVIPNDARGNFSLAHLEAAITPQTRLIAITHIASATGGIMPVAEIGIIARKHGILYLVDACQSVGQMPVDVQQINCDMLSVTGRKYLRAPRGTGFLYVRKEVQDQLKPLFMDGHSIEWINETEYQLRNDAMRFELYEKSRALTLGLAKAVEYAMGLGMERIWQRVQSLAALLREQLSHINGIAIHDIGDHQCGIVTFSIKGMDSQRVKSELAARNIHVSVGVARSTLLFMNRHQLPDVVRASVHYYNTEHEIKTMCAVLASIIL